MARLALVFVAIHLTTPSVSQSPGLVAIHRQETLVSRLSGSKRLYHWHVQITGHGLVGTGVAVVKGELFSPARIFFRCDRGIHVFICSVAESTRLRAGLEGTPPHSARIIAVSKITVRDGTGGRGLRNRWARCALLDWLCRTWSRYVHSGIAGAVDEAGRVATQSRVGHQIPALVGRKITASNQSLHVLQLIQVVFIHIHNRVCPARIQDEGGGHSTLTIRTENYVAKTQVRSRTLGYIGAAALTQWTSVCIAVPSLDKSCTTWRIKETLTEECQSFFVFLSSLG